jgi:hypothetical protein
LVPKGKHKGDQWDNISEQQMQTAMPVSNWGVEEGKEKHHWEVEKGSEVALRKLEHAASSKLSADICIDICRRKKTYVNESADSTALHNTTDATLSSKW